MTTQTLTGVTISLEGVCQHDSCSDFAFPLYTQLRDGYERCSVLTVPISVNTWREEHRTARKRADRATRLGYHFAEIRREEYDEHIYFINTSLDSRQGRPMSAGYMERQHFLPLPTYPCERHCIRTYGVISARGQLVAYLWLYRSGHMALVSQILGHGDHLQNDVMYLLFQGVVESQSLNGGFFVYNLHSSGTDGLRYFKSKLGFDAMEVSWEL